MNEVAVIIFKGSEASCRVVHVWFCADTLNQQICRVKIFLKNVFTFSVQLYFYGHMEEFEKMVKKCFILAFALFSTTCLILQVAASALSPPALNKFKEPA